MAHRAQLENKKYRNWVRAGLGIKYVKEGLEPFCDHLVNQQHIAILDEVKRKHNLLTVSCGLCDVRTLQPDHVQTKTRQCPLGQMYCNCQYPRGKISCPNKVCGAIYDQIIKFHASTPPAPYWKNTDVRQWCTEPWSVAKCYINAPGYEQKTKANEFDCPGLLHVLLNNIGFQQHIKCVITGTDVFSRVRISRNDVFHSNCMELEDKDVNCYIDDMIELLEDETEIKHRQESKDAVKKLQELKQEHFIISTIDEAEIRRDAMAAVNEKERELKKTIADAVDKIKTTADEEKHDIEGKSSVIKSELEQTRQKISKELVMKEAELEQTGQKSQKDLTEGSMTSIAETRKEVVTSKSKTDFQKKLVKLYELHVRKIAPLSRLYKERRNVSEMYVPLWLTVEVKKEAFDEKSEVSNEWEELKISIDEIFRNKERSAKNIYVIGDAGSGKTMLCKMLVHFWVIVQEYSLNVPGMVKEMKHFKFLFYISLRDFSDCDSIENMIEKSYSDPALRDILRNDSSACLIILDGLDEWDPERKHISPFLTPGLPGRELGKDYTIITTSRQWKFDVLPLSCIEVDKKIKLNGMDRYEIRNFTKKTVETLNEIYQKSKNAEECITDLRSRQVSDISHTPLVLQQLISLWFHNKLKNNSKCAIYRSMLDLFLEWKTLGTSESQEQLYVINTTSRNTRVIKYLSYLAYETLFDKNKETALAFSNSKLTQLSIPHDVIKDCLASGILKEERNVSLSIQSSISFFHKAMQEYLAAEHIAYQFREMLKSQKDGLDLTNVCKLCVRKYFGSCKTVVDILEQSNVLIILCGLEPRLLTNISEYFYNVTLVDKMVVEERNKVPEISRSDPLTLSLDHHTLINDIQACILKCIEEVMSITKNVRLRVYIADLYVSRSTDLLRYGHNIVLKNVLSIAIVDGMPARYKKDDIEAVKHLIKCDQLKVIKFTFDRDTDERVKNEVTTILETNVRTLETIRFRNIDRDIITITRLVSILPKMRQLISLQVETHGSHLTHDDIVPLCKFLKQTASLQHISLDIYCSKYDEHMIDLSKHKQLQHVDFWCSSFCTVRCNTDNLDTCKLVIESANMMKQVCNCLYKADKLKHLELSNYFTMRSKKTDTESLIRLLSSLVRLSTLMLKDFIFTNNILARPCDMKNLKEIKLDNVAMSMTTWCEFIDSLPALPQEVTVTISDMDIRDETLLKFRTLEALKHCMEKRNFFRIKEEDQYDPFKFTTRKV